MGLFNGGSWNGAWLVTWLVKPGGRRGGCIGEWAFESRTVRGGRRELVLPRGMMHGMNSSRGIRMNFVDDRMGRVGREGEGAPSCHTRRSANLDWRSPDRKRTNILSHAIHFFDNLEEISDAPEIHHDSVWLLLLRGASRNMFP